MTKKEAIDVINNLRAKDVKDAVEGLKVNNYTIYNFYFDLENNEVLLGYCVTDDKDNYVVPLTYHITNKNDENSDSFMVDILDNNLAIVASSDNKKNYLIDLKEDNYINNKLKKDKILLSFLGYILTENNYLICINEDACLIYNLNTRLREYKFDYINLYDKELICFYKARETEVSVKFDYDMNLKEDEIEAIVGKWKIYPYIPKNILSRKYKTIKYVKEVVNKETNINFVDACTLDTSRRYMQ